MPLASFVATNFLGGEISQSAQGRMDLPSYKISLNVCLNAIPIEPGVWMRRPGTRHVAPTRGGAQGRLIPFAFAQNYPYVMEFTDGFLRFTTGPALVMTNDAQAVTAISSANPAEVTTTTAHGWSTGNAVAFDTLGSNNPLLQNRQFTITVTATDKFTLADGITGAAIDGATLGAFVSGNVTRVLEIATAYTAGSWSTVRSVQAEQRTVLLNGTHPQVLQVATVPTPTHFATFTYAAADFIDGPYLDPVAGSVVTSSALNGVVSLTFSYEAYDSTRAYRVGDFVSSVGLGYRSLTAPNQGNTPASSASDWVAVNGGAAINNGTGFVASDIGRLVRLFSEPALYSVTSAYVAGDRVSYADGNGGYSYWYALGSIAAGNLPGSTTSWLLDPSVALWTWAQITSVSGLGLVTPVSAIGSGGLSGGGGVSAAFDGNTSKAAASCALFSTTTSTAPAWAINTYASGSIVQYNSIVYTATMAIVDFSAQTPWGPGIGYAAGQIVQIDGFEYQAGVNNPNQTTQPASNPAQWSVLRAISTVAPPFTTLWAQSAVLASPTYDLYIGQHYTTATVIQSATIYPSSDIGFENSPSGAVLGIRLRASNSAPSLPSDGTLLGGAGFTANTFSSVTITSSDNVSAWNYVWFEIIVSYLQPLYDDGSHVFTPRIAVCQAQFFSPNVSNGSVVTAQIRGAALPNNQTIRTWRLGVYSDTTGWPTCGAYHEGRLWLGGVVSNRFDACVSNGLIGAQINFTPTGPNGLVAANNAISYVCTGEDVNQILWMTPDQQGILFGTKAGEWLISAPSQGPLAPANVKAVRVTKIGCANIEPRRAEHTLLFVQKFGRKIMEYFADVFSGKFSAPNLSERAKHVTVSGLQEVAYQQELAPILWARRGDGVLVGATYKRNSLTTSQGPDIIGWHRHTFGSGHTTESLCVGPSVNGTLDTLSMISNNPNTGIRHIELMTDLIDENFALIDCWFLDDGIVPSSTVVQLSPTGGAYGSLLVNGLSSHNGKLVTAFIAGLDCGDFTVSGGSITIPFGDGVSGGAGSGLFTQALVESFTTLPAVVGFTYISDGQLVRPVTQADTGARSGPAFAKNRRQHRVGAQLYGCVNGSISFGTDFTKLDPAKLLNPNGVPYTVQELWSGIWRDSVNSSYDFDGMIAWRISRPLPAFVIAVGGFDAAQDA